MVILCTTYLNIIKLCVLSMQCIYVFHMIHRKAMDSSPNSINKLVLAMNMQHVLGDRKII
jgi:hypothetical protein